jgi:hypothetical protein
VWLPFIYLSASYCCVVTSSADTTIREEGRKEGRKEGQKVRKKRLEGGARKDWKGEGMTEREKCFDDFKSIWNV